MLCSNCSKLAIHHLKKKCIHCQGEVLQNISVVCDRCSSQTKQCSACLRKINETPKRQYYGGCASCRR